MNLANIRKEYISKGINENDITETPFTFFENWLKEAISNKLSEPTAMHVATVSKEGRPSGRIVLLKSFNENGFVFFTNYESRKGKELEQNRFASLTFFWSELFRQVRIEGSIEKTNEIESDEYFLSRPRGSQISAIVSKQSTIIENRKELELKIKSLEKEYSNNILKRSKNWGGYILAPEKIEFWQGRENRLHDRLCYTLDKKNIWNINWLYP